jgi:hypothetical protein
MMREGFRYSEIISHKALLCLPNCRITDVKIGRQVLEKRVVSQDLELWLSNVSCIISKGFTWSCLYWVILLIEHGIQKQEALKYVCPSIPFYLFLNNV